MNTTQSLQRLQVRENGFAFEPASGVSYTLSASAVRMVAWLHEGCPVGELSARLVKEYETTLHIAARDVDTFISTLRVYKLL